MRKKASGAENRKRKLEAQEQLRDTRAGREAKAFKSFSKTGDPAESGTSEFPQSVGESEHGSTDAGLTSSQKDPEIMEPAEDPEDSSFSRTVKEPGDRSPETGRSDSPSNHALSDGPENPGPSSILEDLRGTDNGSLEVGQSTSECNPKLSEPVERPREFFDDVSTDPSTWPEVVPTPLCDFLVRQGPLKVSEIEFPRDQHRRHFPITCTKRTLTNGEQVNRRWLIYSKASDKAYCFCCKLFGTRKSSK